MKTEQNINVFVRGHETRGEEVIKLLEERGGINKYNLKGCDASLIYLIHLTTKAIVTYFSDNECVMTNRIELKLPEEEKKELFDELKEMGLKWNAEEKKLEKILWRAEKGGLYFYVNYFNEIVSSFDERFLVDDELYRIGNYFQNREEAQKHADKIEELLQTRRL